MRGRFDGVSSVRTSGGSSHGIAGSVGLIQRVPDNPANAPRHAHPRALDRDPAQFPLHEQEVTEKDA